MYSHRLRYEDAKENCEAMSDAAGKTNNTEAVYIIKDYKDFVFISLQFLLLQWNENIHNWVSTSLTNTACVNSSVRKKASTIAVA